MSEKRCGDCRHWEQLSKYDGPEEYGKCQVTLPSAPICYSKILTFDWQGRNCVAFERKP